MRITSYPSGRRGLTRAEVIVVVVMILLVGGLGVSGVLRFTADMRYRLTNQCHLKILALSTNHAQESGGKLPQGYGTFRDKTGSVLYHLLPYVEEDPIYADPANGSPSVKLFRSRTDTTAPGGFVTLGGANYGAASYAWNDALSNLRISHDFIDGTSHTMMFTEKVAVCGSGGNVWWLRPPEKEGERFASPAFAPILPTYEQAMKLGIADAMLPQIGVRSETCNPYRASTINPDVINVAFCDGSVRPFSTKIGESSALSKTELSDKSGRKTVWHTLLTPNDKDNKGEENDY